MPPKRKVKSLGGNELANNDNKRSKKSADLLPDGFPLLNVALTGATEGDILEGIIRKTGANDSAGVILVVAQGCINASGVHCQHVTEDQLVGAYQRDYNLSASVARQCVRGRQVSSINIDNAISIGSGCPDKFGVHSVWGQGGSVNDTGTLCNCTPQALFRILQPGVWIDVASEFGWDGKLMDYVKEETLLSWRQILQLFGNHTLMLRATLFAVGSGPRVVSMPSERAIMCTFSTKQTVTYAITEKNSKDDIEVTVDAPSPSLQENTVANALRLVMLACPSIDPDDAKKALSCLRHLTLGGLKSAMQKTVRFCAAQVVLADGSCIPSSVYAAASCILAALHPGGFVPELQTMTRGCTAAFKRTAVILVEDGWTGSPRKLQSLMGTALVTQAVPNFYPVEECYIECIRLLVAATASPVLIDWRYNIKKKSRETSKGMTSARILPSGVTVNEYPMSSTKANAFKNAALMLDILGSFPGDKAMMHDVAESAKAGVIRVLQWDKQSQQSDMPHDHIWDQHVQRGIGHVMQSPAETFAGRFAQVFGSVTGVNPRMHDISNFESRSEVEQTRFAQLVLMRFAAPQLYSWTTLSVLRKEEVVYKVDPGTLAAGVGPVPIEVNLKTKGRPKRNLLVMLGTVVSSVETVMLAPTRSNIEDYLEWGNKSDPVEMEYSEKERRAARLACRKMRLRVQSPLLPSGHAEFMGDEKGSGQGELVEGDWTFNGRSWNDIVENGLKTNVDIHPPPEWAQNISADLLLDDMVILEALSSTGGATRGLVEGAHAAVVRLCQCSPPTVVSRAHSLIRQQFERVVMPVPSLKGGLGSDQLQAYPGDWKVWRLLVLLSRLVPGALRPQIAPRFVVPNAVLLVLLSEWMVERPEIETSVAASGTVWHTARNSAIWINAFEVAERVLKQHQRDAVTRMKERCKRGLPGHYLVMETGHGKTYAALSYAMWRMLHTPLGNRVRRIVWITPPGEKIDKGLAGGPQNFTLIRSLLEEFEPPDALIEVPVSFVDKKNPTFCDFTLCVVHHDHVRDMMDELTAVAADSFFVFDEVDCFYGPSQRTSNGLRLAALCAEFIAQTATPVPGKGKIDRLAAWLGLTEEYPITAKNYLVAACNMVSLKVSLGINRIYKIHEIPPSAQADGAFREYRANRDWAKLFRILQEDTDVAFCERVYHYAVSDRNIIPTGGCFAVCQDQRHVSRLIALFQSRYSNVLAGDKSVIDDPCYGAVFIASSNNRGYNAGVRLGVQVRQPYPGNGADRHQMEGRICRLSQQRQEVVYEVVYMKYTLMELLYQRQERDDSVNHSLDQLAEEYDRSVLDGIA